MLSSVHEGQTRPIAEALPRLSVQKAAAERLVLDGRLGAVVQRWTGLRAGPSSLRPPAAEPIRLLLSSVVGEFTLELDAGSSPEAAMLHRFAREAAGSQDLAGIATAWVQGAARGTPVESLELRVIEASCDAASDAAALLPTVQVGPHRVAFGSVDVGFGLFLEEELRAAGAALHQLAAALRLRPCLELGLRRLAARQVRRGRPGDMLLLGTLPVTASWRVGGRRGRRASVHLQSLEAPVLFSSAPQPYEDTLNSEAAIDASDEALGDIEIPVAFEIDATAIDLATLSTLGPGQVITLDGSIQNATVHLRSNGQTLGRGQLVAVGTYLGVRIERMAWTRHDDAQH